MLKQIIRHISVSLDSSSEIRAGSGYLLISNAVLPPGTQNGCCLPGNMSQFTVVFSSMIVTLWVKPFLELHVDILLWCSFVKFFGFIRLWSYDRINSGADQGKMSFYTFVPPGGCNLRLCKLRMCHDWWEMHVDLIRATIFNACSVIKSKNNCKQPHPLPARLHITGEQVRVYTLISL